MRLITKKIILFVIDSIKKVLFLDKLSKSENAHKLITPIIILIMPKNKELLNVPRKGNKTKGKSKVAIKEPK